MDARSEHEPTPTKNHTTVERKSGCELVITRTFNGPVRSVFAAWTTPGLLKKWWAPKSSCMSLHACAMDVRVGGGYRFSFVFDSNATKPMEFFGKYLEVTPYKRLVWTNDEGTDGGPITTVTFTEQGGKTQLVVQELYPSQEALDGAIASGMDGGICEAHEQLDELLATEDF